MFEGEEEKPSAFAIFWVLFLGIDGGLVGVYFGSLFLGQEWLQSGFVLIACFLVGTAVGVKIAIRWLIPRPSQE